jgi:cell wall-associated NlpC family hydrolase
MRRIHFALLALCPLLWSGCATAAPAEGLSRIGFSIQVGAFAEVKNAERLTTALQSKGVEAFYFKKENGVYAVRFGDFPKKDAARKAAEKLVGEKIIGTYYIAPPFCATPPGKPVKPAGKPEKKPKKVEECLTPKGDREMGAIAAKTAERFVGIPYRWGGNTVVDGMDCSGFVRAVFNLCGVNIPRTSGEQFQTGQGIDRGDLREGDLVFFGDSASRINHVGIYVGDGRFVHAPRRGDDIKVSRVDEVFYEKRFVGARRYF